MFVWGVGSESCIVQLSFRGESLGFVPSIHCEQSLFCSKIRTENERDCGFSTRRSYVTHVVTLIFRTKFRAKERLLAVYAKYFAAPYSCKNVLFVEYTLLHTDFTRTRYSGAPAARRAAKRSPIIIEKGTTRMQRNRNPCNSFFWSKWLAAWITGACAQRRRRRTTSHNMAAIQLIPSHAVLDYSIYR